jgi:hypothetical protein
VKLELKKLGCLVIKVTPGTMGTRSTPDTFATRKDVGGFWIEFKRDKNAEKQAGQIEMCRRLNEHGTRAVFITSWDEWTQFSESMELKRRLDAAETL